MVHSRVDWVVDFCLKCKHYKFVTAGNDSAWKIQWCSKADNSIPSLIKNSRSYDVLGMTTCPRYNELVIVKHQLIAARRMMEIGGKNGSK